MTTRAGNKPRKLTTANWPTQYLVLFRTTMDDYPVMLTPDRKLAFLLARSTRPEDKLVRRVEKVMGLDGCSPVNMTIITFRNGVPVRMKIVHDFTAEEGPEA